MHFFSDTEMSEADIPIDIAVRKLLDWLVSRRICSRSWHEGVTAIREKVGEAIGDMPEHQGIKELLTGSNINYFTCLKIVEFLKDTEKDSKNFFGSYGSQRMKDWQQIVKLYQGDNIYLAEAASTLAQNVVYEGPGIKKSLVKCDQVEQDCDKKEENIRKRIIELEEEFKKECKELGISGEGSIKKEIIGLAKGLPDTYLEMAEEAKDLAEACDLYDKFVKSMLDEGVTEEVIGNLRFLIEHGNTTTYEWKFREKPISVEETELVFDDEDGEDDGGEIDFGDGEIDFGAEEDVDFGREAEIDFGDSGAEIDFGEGEIDFGESGEIDFGDIDVDTSAIVVEEGGMAGGVAKDEEALTILDNRRTRLNIIDELEELAGFLAQRLVEATSSGSKFNLVSSGVDHEPETLQKMLQKVELMSSKLCEVKMQQLQLIRSSPGVVDRLVDRLKGKLKMVEKVRMGRQELEKRREQVSKDRAEGNKQLGIILAKTKELQTDVEADISKRYNGRRVNIMGVAI